MIISEKQITDLMQVAQLYLRVLDNLTRIDPDLVSECGRHNLKNVASLLQTINEQQCTELKDIKDDNCEHECKKMVTPSGNFFIWLCNKCHHIIHWSEANDNQ